MGYALGLTQPTEKGIKMQEKIVQNFWKSYKQKNIPKETTAVQLYQLETAFNMGALCLLKFMMDNQREEAVDITEILTEIHDFLLPTQN